MASHKASGFVCLVAHIPDESGDAQCEQCAYCGEFIRPHKMHEECPASETEEGKNRLREALSMLRPNEE
jgi:ribosomal protein L32